MLIYALDDEPFLLADLEEAIAEAEPTAQIHSFSRAKPALREMEENGLYPDVAFLDIEMPGMSGLELAKRIKDRSPKTNIVFVTGFRQYAAEAAQLRMSGYVMKPVSAEKIRAELEDLRHPIEYKSDKRVRVQCFGHFEVFVDEKPLSFRYSKTKELFAYLIDRKGAAVHADELIAVLWEDKPVSVSLRNQLRNSIHDLTRTLKSVGAGAVLLKTQRSFSIDVSQVDCDYYQFLQAQSSAVNTYGGEYMSQYSWPEMTIAALDRIK